MSTSDNDIIIIPDVIVHPERYGVECVDHILTNDPTTGEEKEIYYFKPLPQPSDPLDPQ